MQKASELPRESPAELSSFAALFPSLARARALALCRRWSPLLYNAALCACASEFSQSLCGVRKAIPWHGLSLLLYLCGGRENNVVLHSGFCCASCSPNLLSVWQGGGRDQHPATWGPLVCLRPLPCPPVGRAAVPPEPCSAPVRGSPAAAEWDRTCGVSGVLEAA